MLNFLLDFPTFPTSSHRSSLTTRKRNPASPERLKKAVAEVVEGSGLRPTAAKFNVDKQTLSRYVQKFKNSQGILTDSFFVRNYAANMLLTDEQEALLEQYLKTASQLYCGLNSVQARQIAYLYAVQHQVKVPPVWQIKSMATYDWLRGFLSRHRMLSFCKPDASRVAKNMETNQCGIQELFFQVHNVVAQCKLESIEN